MPLPLQALDRTQAGTGTGRLTGTMRPPRAPALQPRPCPLACQGQGRVRGLVAVAGDQQGVSRARDRKHGRMDADARAVDEEPGVVSPKGSGSQPLRLGDDTRGGAQVV